MTSPRRTAFATVVAIVAAAALASGHELFLHPRGFFVAPHATITLPVFDGSFDGRGAPDARGTSGMQGQASARQRIRDLSLRGPAGTTAIDRRTWTERGGRGTVRVTVGGPGTYVAGVEIAPRTSSLEGAAFDRHLADEGLAAILDRRRATGRLGRPARTSITRAARTLIAVTDAAGHVAPRSRDGRSAALVASGYAAEIVPLVDPYTRGVGAIVPVRALVGGKPLAGWTIHAGGTIGTSTAPIPLQVLTTDRDGRVEVRLTHDGHWFIAFVHVVEAAPGAPVDYVSRSATLTFGVLPADRPGAGPGPRPRP